MERNYVKFSVFYEIQRVGCVVMESFILVLCSYYFIIDDVVYIFLGFELGVGEWGNGRFGYYYFV